MTEEQDRQFMALALAEAEQGMADGGLPIGAVLVRNGEVVAAGHNQRVQQGDPIAHGEMDCLRKAGRQRSYRDTVLYTTLSPCMMCSGTILQFGIPRVVIGEAENFEGDIPFLRERGVEVTLMDDEGCKGVMRRFLAQPGNLELWHEDIAED
ncbi:nucleoside deaminase [Paracoccus alkanivorans]|uniref:Nucleoside deaminase n=1 Tax=Paracoccus alkanivorans TaxID=2116655 RepID=A0A3M0MF03_9RHOB|nr:nucleoside deaminase [Paracoccus alkanivorans]RMC36312.1 nucleoside deaminase [Paracoccus alkanivorans]